MNDQVNRVAVRKFEDRDLSALAQLFDQYRQFYEEQADYPLAEAFIRARTGRGESTILVAESADGSLNGFCQLYPSFCSLLAKPIYVLNDLFVPVHARRQGVAKKLMDAAQLQGRLDGKARLDLTTAKTNLKAQALYESQGWMRDEVYYAYNLSLDS